MGRSRSSSMQRTTAITSATNNQAHLRGRSRTPARMTPAERPNNRQANSKKTTQVSWEGVASSTTKPVAQSEEYKQAFIDSRELKVSLDRKTLEVETLTRQVAELTAQVETLKTRPLAPSPLPQQQPPPPLATNFKPAPLLLPQRAPAQTQPATQETRTQETLHQDEHTFTLQQRQIQHQFQQMQEQLQAQMQQMFVEF